MSDSGERRDWLSAIKQFAQPQPLTLLLLGFSAGLPLLLIFSSLSLWLREAGVERAAVTFFGWAALGYSFKFIWAPLVDKLPLPYLTARLGRRRAWLLLAQLMVIGAIAWMGLTDPQHNLVAMALAAALLGFSSATQDIVIDAYRIEAAEQELQALLAASYIAGYRIGMLVAGAGALKLAAYFGTTTEEYVYDAWRLTYLCMALVMLIGVLTTLLIKEPQRAVNRATTARLLTAADYGRFLGLFICVVAAFVLSFVALADLAAALTAWLVVGLGWYEHLAGFSGECLRLLGALAAAWAAGALAVKLGLARRELLRETYIEPVADFIRRYQGAALLILALIGSYRVADIVMGAVANVFYQDIGFTKNQIADVTKVFGLLMTVLGGFLGGALALKFGVMRILLLGALLAAVTNLLFALLAQLGPDMSMLIVAVAADNLSAGIASAAFVAYLSSLTNISFTALQYAVFSSLMTLAPKLIAGYSGTLVDAMGYPGFFVFSALLGLPVLGLVWLAAKADARA